MLHEICNFKSRMYIKLLHNQRLLTMFLKINLFLFLIIFLLIFFLFIIFLLLCSCSFFFLTTLWGLWVSLLLAWSLSKPLGESSGRSLAPFIVFLFPARFKVFSSDNFPASLIHFLSVIIRSGICSTLILGVHADLWWVLSSKGLWVKTLLKGLSSELSLLSLLELLEVKLLSEFPLLIVIFVSLKLDDDLEELLSLGLDLIRVHGLKFKWLDSDAKGNLLLFLKLLLTLSLSLLKALLLLLSFLGLPLSLFLLHLL